MKYHSSRVNTWMKEDTSGILTGYSPFIFDTRTPMSEGVAKVIRSCSEVVPYLPQVFPVYCPRKSLL